MKLYNTMSRQIEELVPINPPTVKMYSCGPTVYDEPHVGNWSAYVYWDILVRALTLNGYKVERVINLTDVGHLVSDADEGEDKLAKRANRDKVTAWEIADKYIASFMSGFRQLNLVEPIKFARATDFIPEQLEIIRQLKNLGLTYQISDGIYYNTAKLSDYGKLARLNIENLKAGARVEYNPEKLNPTDFALWKFSQEKRDMEWETPTDLLESVDETPVMGFPGWHLECSAIIHTLLGEEIDIHTGGIDHIPIHHTNEIAQMEPITKKPVARFWLHNHHLKVDGTKISKSLGNGYVLTDLAQRGFSPIDFRMLVLQSHFQSEGNFSFDNLEAAANRLKRWRKFADLRHQIYQQTSDNPSNLLASKQHILNIINSNLDTPKALTEIDQVFHQLEELEPAQINRPALTELIQFIDNLLGFDLIKKSPDIDDEDKKLIKQREHARAEQDYKKADKIRNQLTKKGILLDDKSENKTVWFYA
ncbi:MAG: cysteine--tRNA ligase [Candidatus Nanosyncoccaceae bacterium]|jgi:cysteinyl-tRNA synthetase